MTTPRAEPIFASRDLALKLGAIELVTLPDGLRPDITVALWRGVADRIAARTHLTIFAESGIVLAWPRVPEQPEPTGPPTCPTA